MTPEQIKQARKEAGLTQEEAGKLVGGGKRTWQNWEYGTRIMPAAKWELFLIKTKK